MTTENSERVHGFEQVSTATIEELNTTANLYRHVQTGAQLLSLENSDENKVFGVTFRTPPPDSTGIAHILEHSVLGGSQKYPLKEPFVQLIKGSLKTFLNALTYPDRTVYPVASTNLQDFYNLVDVYLDAVFHPLITRQHLEQEGWHYELEEPDGPLKYRGVVFNEMKGAYSSPDNLLHRTSQRSLFPDNAYGLDSGGDPAEIPELTYEQFQDFHATYYHPSNALIYFYGDDDPMERLRLLDAVLSEFVSRPPQSAASTNGKSPNGAPAESTVPLQPAFDAPQRVVQPYGVDAESDETAKSMVQLNWLLPEGQDSALVMALSMLSYALVSTQASPLRKTLIDSGLGEDLTGGGLSTTLRQMTFHVGLKGVEAGREDAVEQLILQTLARIAEEGFDPDMVEAAYNTFEFNLRENNTGSIPRGLAVMMRALRTWIYGGDPFAPLAFEGPLQAVRRELDADPTYFQSLIRTYLLENEHRTTVIMQPDPEYNQEWEAAEKERLAAVRAGMNQEDLQAIKANTEALRKRQETPDSPDLLAKLPMLRLQDLDREIKTIPTVQDELDEGQLLYHDLFTNGIVYLDLGFDLHGIAPELLPYAELFSRALIEIGTEEEDFVKLSHRIGRATGGIHTGSLISSSHLDPQGVAYMMVRGKATMKQAPELLAIMRDILLTVKLDDRERLRQMVLKSKANFESSLVPAGHSWVDGRLRAGFSTADWADEQMGGIAYLRFLRGLANKMDEDWPGVLAKLEAVREQVVNRGALIANVTLDADNWQHFQPQLQEFVETLPAQPVQPVAWPKPTPGTNEGLSIPAQVNYVGKGANLYDLGYTLDGSIDVITNFLRTGYLWDKIRVQGGAYGAFCRFSKQSGVLTLLSYRDPNLLNTLDVYDGAASFLQKAEITEDDLTKSIIGAIGSLDAPQLPDAKGYTALTRHLLGISDKWRQQLRDQVLDTKAADFRAFGDVLDAVRQEGRVVVLGAQHALDEANSRRGDLLQIQRLL